MTRFVLLATVASLMAAPSIASGKEPVLSADRLRADVEFLADDLLEGRLPGTSGYDLAAAYVATRFSAMGLRPANPDGSWYQQMPFAEFAINADKPNELLVGTTRFAMGDGVVMRPTPRWGDKTRTTTAGAVFVGYGTDADYAGLEVAGKIVIVLPDVPESLKGEARNKALSEDKAEVAKRHGARGMFSIYRVETQADKDVWRASADAMTKARQIWLTPQGEVAGPKPPLEVTAFVNGAVVDALFKGARMSAQQMFAAVDRGDMVRGFALASPVTLVHTDRVTVKTAPNVVGVLPGSDPALASEYVVLSAHLDHLGRDPDLKGDQIYNGAMDNATGVAAMLEVARAFTESEKRPKRSIMFVALTAEEKGLWGSNFLASYPIKGRENVVADVNLDMPILLYDFSDIVAFGAEHSTLGRIVDRAARQAGIALSPDPLPEEHLFERSDHYSFVKKGIPSIYLVTGFQKGGEKAFRSFLSTNYHKVTDDIRQPINWQAGAKFARINYLIARGITDAKQAPMWYQGSRYADLFAPNAPRARVLKETKPQ